MARKRSLTQRHKRVTARDVARHAGVSPATVSVVLSGRRDIGISAATWARVMRSVEELGYVPSMLGKGFLQGRSRTIGVVMHFHRSTVWVDAFHGIQMVLDAAGYVPIVVSPNKWSFGFGEHEISPHSMSDEMESVRRLLEYQVAGVLYYSVAPELSAGALDELARRRVPTVMTGLPPFDANRDFVGADEEEIGRMAARHLLSLNPDSFVVCEYAARHRPAERRRDAFIAELARAGKTCGIFTVNGEEGRKGLSGHLGRLLRPLVGVFAVNEDLASMTMRAAAGLGWRVPEDFAVVGMGDFNLARRNFIPITTVNRGSVAIVTQAIKLLLERINGFDGPPQRIFIAPTLEVRQSTMPTLPKKKKPRAPGRKNIA